MLGTAMGDYHGGGEKREKNEQIAERPVTAEMRKRRWTKQELSRSRKTDPSESDDVGAIAGGSHDV